jgi:serine/threonine protein kinase
VAQAQTQTREFGKYELLEKLATGGMAEIYRARYHAMPGVTKPLVIKKILPAFANNSNFVSMFINEAKIAVGLSHGNIAQVFDFGELGGEYFLAMEFVHGQPLSKVLKRCRKTQIPALPVPFAILIAAEMCKGLHYAHTRLDEKKQPLNIIHRDVSPQNVIVSYEGQVKIVDFGIAKARTAGRTETEAGAVKGKYLYFSPEQARGKEMDARTDVWATGVVLYEMLCGRLPFEGKMISVLSNIVKGNFRPPRELNPDLPEELERLILQAMALDKEQRFPTAQAFGEALTSYLYRSAPQFSVSSLHGLMEFLFEEELKGEGVPVRISREILEQVPMWRKQLPHPPPPSVPPSSGARTSAERRRSRGGRSQPSAAVEPASELPTGLRHPPKWAYVGVPLAAMLAAAATVLVLFRPPPPNTFVVHLSSDPPRASVWVDSQPIAKPTPVDLELKADAAHVIEVRAPGMKPWQEPVALHRGESEKLFAQLSPFVPVPGRDETPSVNPPSPPTVPAQATSDLPSEASYPIAGFTVSARQHTLVVPTTNAARIKLDPKKTYKITAEGRISLGGPLDAIFVTQAMYFVEGSAELEAGETFGLVGHKAITIHHARALYAFVLDDKPEDNSGAIVIRVKPRGSRETSTMLVDGRANAVSAPAGRYFNLLRLNALDRYEVRIEPGNPSAKTRNGQGGEVGRLAYVQNAGWNSVLEKGPVDDTQRILEVGRKYQVTGASWMKFLFLDDAAEDNEGTLRVEIRPLAGYGGGLQLDRILKH